MNAPIASSKNSTPLPANFIGECLNSVKRKAGSTEFKQRLAAELPRLIELLSIVYAGRDDLQKHVLNLVKTLENGFNERPKHLRLKDSLRVEQPLWHKSEQMVGMACYVDLVAGDLKKLQQKLPYFVDLGITYLHLMPLYKSPEGDSDGGYAVSDYRAVNPSLGTMDDLRELAEEMDRHGISLVMDFVFNHTADEHEWAVAARSGDTKFRDYYYIFDDRSMPDAYERTLREIFPAVRRGSFTQLPETGQWVWTTFNNFQWDLNYSNPEVFAAVVGEMLFLANTGCDCLRLDALAFIWKEMGTSCENQPNAHRLIQAFNACLKIAAPSVVFKSEAIVHPDEVVQYIGPDECQLSYNPLLMALIWNSIATRKTRLMTQSLSYRFPIDSRSSWVNYARCHDDIGWTFDDKDAEFLGINGYDHRLFLNKFFTGQFDGSFATGMGFQFNPSNGDCRVCGSLASLAGLEQALKWGDDHLIEMAVRRIIMIHGIILSIGGIPLLYAGDELAILNDYSFLQDDHKKHDARWVNRPQITDQAIALAQTEGTVQQRVFSSLKRMIAIRKKLAVLGDARTMIYQTGNPHALAYLRAISGGDKVLVLCNFNDHDQYLEPSILDKLSPAHVARDLLTGRVYNLTQREHVKLEALQTVWLHTTPTGD